MASPELENGFSRIANELAEAIALKIRSARQLKILFFLIRETYGYQQKFARFKPAKIAEKTGIFVNHVRLEIKKMFAQKIIIFDENGDIGIQKDYEKWETKTVSKDTETVLKNTKTVSKKRYQNSISGETETVSLGDQNSIFSSNHTFSVFKETPKEKKTKERREELSPPARGAPPFSGEKVSEGEKSENEILPPFADPETGDWETANEEEIPVESFFEEENLTQEKTGENLPEKKELPPPIIETPAPVKIAKYKPTKGSEKFERCWAQYPKIRLGPKKKAWAEWQRGGLEEIGEDILADILHRKQNFKKWRDGFSPECFRYLNHRGWEETFQLDNQGDTHGQNNTSRDEGKAPRERYKHAHERTQELFDGIFRQLDNQHRRGQ